MREKCSAARTKIHGRCFHNDSSFRTNGLNCLILAFIRDGPSSTREPRRPPECSTGPTTEIREYSGAPTGELASAPEPRQVDARGAPSSSPSYSRQPHCQPF